MPATADFTKFVCGFLDRNTELLVSLVQQLFGPYLLQKGKIVPRHALKARVGSRGIAPVILDLVTDGGEWSRSPRHFTPLKELQYP